MGIYCTSTSPVLLDANPGGRGAVEVTDLGLSLSEAIAK